MHGKGNLLYDSLEFSVASSSAENHVAVCFRVVLMELRALKLERVILTGTATLKQKLPDGFELQKNKHQALHLQGVKCEIHLQAAEPEMGRVNPTQKVLNSFIVSPTV